MIKVVLVLLVALGFLTAHAPTRTRIAETAAPALEKLGPVGQFALRPVHGWTAHSEVDFLADQIELARELGRETPTETSFQDWIKKRAQTRNGGNDPWGGPYFYTRGQTTFTVGSMGRDGQRNTPDDITQSGPF